MLEPVDIDRLDDARRPLAGPLPPGATIGILGGGQLGRMIALAAARLGYRCHVYAPEPDSPAAQVAARAITAPYLDPVALARFAAGVDVVTLEFENVPLMAAKLLARHVPMAPGPQALAVAQHRLTEKRFARAAGVATAPFRPVTSLDMLAHAVEAIGTPAILKTCRFGYDGKGQIRLDPGADLERAWQALGDEDAILEGLLDFACEISVITARGADGATRSFPVGENCHRDGILARTNVPARIGAETEAAAAAIGERLAAALDLVGLLAVELFVTRDGRVLMNEIAPRPHNSGHWTMDGCQTSQFEQLVRAVCGLPLGPTGLLGPTEMQNLIGEEAAGWPALLAEPGARLHLYGKAETRPGRKMGHVNRVKFRPPPLPDPP